MNKVESVDAVKKNHGEYEGHFRRQHASLLPTIEKMYGVM